MLPFLLYPKRDAVCFCYRLVTTRTPEKQGEVRCKDFFFLSDFL